MVETIFSTQELQNLRSTENKSVGFVPTMGNLHQGHISLLTAALDEFDVVYFSIFVNPKQFGPTEDFNRYPRTLENDLELIQKSLHQKNKRVIVFAPKSPSDIYAGVEYRKLNVTGLSSILEGEIRPGHFEGVATVVYRLFELIKPAKAYFGLKDFQQYLVIKEMVRDLSLPIIIQGMPIIREDSGLAMSSRNQYLTQEEKNKATILYQSLNKIKEIISGKKENITLGFNLISSMKKNDPNWDYLELRDLNTLSQDIQHSKNLTLLAVYKMNQTRLLDNLQMELT